MFYLEIKITLFPNKCLPEIGTSFLTRCAMRSGNISSIYWITVRDIKHKTKRSVTQSWLDPRPH